MTPRVPESKILDGFLGLNNNIFFSVLAIAGEELAVYKERSKNILILYFDFDFIHPILKVISTSNSSTNCRSWVAE